MSLLDFVDPARWKITDRDLDLFASKLGNFVPTDAFPALHSLISSAHQSQTSGSELFRLRFW